MCKEKIIDQKLSKEACTRSDDKMLKSLNFTHTPTPIGIAGEIHVSHGQLKLPSEPIVNICEILEDGTILVKPSSPKYKEIKQMLEVICVKY